MQVKKRKYLAHDKLYILSLQKCCFSDIYPLFRNICTEGKWHKKQGRRERKCKTSFVDHVINNKVVHMGIVVHDWLKNQIEFMFKFMIIHNFTKIMHD